MLTLLAEQPECLWDDALPIEVKELPEDLAALDVLLSDHELLWPLVERWRREFRADRAVGVDGGPADDRDGDLRAVDGAQAALSVGVSDVGGGGVGLDSSAPVLSDLADRAGAGRVDGAQADPADRAETVAELTRALIVKATREKRFRPRAVRIDSTVIEADVKYPTDAGLASAGVRVLAREGRKLAKLIGEKQARVRDRSRSMGRKLRAITRTIRRRSGEAKDEVLKLTSETGELLERSINEARRLAALARRRARGRGAKAKLKAAASLEELADRCEKVARQIHQRVAGEPITGPDRVAVRSGRPADPQGQAGQADRVRVRQPAGGGDREHQAGRARTDPAASSAARQPGREHAAARHRRRARAARDLARERSRVDGGFKPGPTNTALEDLSPEQVFIAGRQEPASKRTTRRLRRYRTGAEGRISHLKRRYGLDRSRLKGDEGQQIWTEWAILAYNADTLAVRTR